MAKDDADLVSTASPLVCCPGGVRLYGPGKAQNHVDGLSWLPVDPAPPEDVLLHVRLLETEEEARRLAQELHSATHLGGQALWKLFRDRYDYKSAHRI